MTCGKQLELQTLAATCNFSPVIKFKYSYWLFT